MTTSLSGKLPSHLTIQVIPHSLQRYNTVGDWYLEEDGTLRVNVSADIDQPSVNLIIIHEVIEALICLAKGITPEEVDEWDFKYADDPAVGEEPGDLPGCPYGWPHQIATIVEKLLVGDRPDGFWGDHLDRMDKVWKTRNESQSS